MNGEVREDGLCSSQPSSFDIVPKLEYVGVWLAFGDVATSDRAEAEKLADKFAPNKLWTVSIRERRIWSFFIPRSGLNM